MEKASLLAFGRIFKELDFTKKGASGRHSLPGIGPINHSSQLPRGKTGESSQILVLLIERTDWEPRQLDQQLVFLLGDSFPFFNPRIDFGKGVLIFGLTDTTRSPTYARFRNHIVL